MADYSWVSLAFNSDDPEVIEEVTRIFGDGENDLLSSDGWTTIAGEKAYGVTDEEEKYLTEAGIEWHRYSDGKYDYDGDESHWFPGQEVRTFSRLDNGGRVFTQVEYQVHHELDDAALGALVREHFEFAKVWLPNGGTGGVERL